jgi:hypothetical protein
MGKEIQKINRREVVLVTEFIVLNTIMLLANTTVLLIISFNLTRTAVKRHEK